MLKRGIISVLVVCILVGMLSFQEKVYANSDDVIVTINPTMDNREINKILETPHEGTLFVKAQDGTYDNLHGTLFIHSNTSFIASDKALFINGGSKNDSSKRYGPFIQSVIEYDDEGDYLEVHDITIRGGQWDSSNLSKDEGTESFRFVHCRNVTMDSVTVCNVPKKSHLVVLAGVKGALIKNCNFYGMYNWNSKNLSTIECKEAVQLDVTHNNTVVPVQAKKINDSLWDDTPCSDVTITGCSFHEFTRGIGSHTAVAGVFHNNITISGNYFYNISDTAMKLFNYTNAVIEGNYLGVSKAGKQGSVTEGILVYSSLNESNESGYYFQPNSGQKKIILPENYNIKICNNLISNTKERMNNGKHLWGDAIRVAGSDSRPLIGVTISGNTISNCERYGVFASHTKDLIINGKNTITNINVDGIKVIDSDGSIISYNTVQKTKQCGIKCTNGTVAKIHHNTIENYGLEKDETFGIYVYKSAAKSADTAVKIYSNKVTGKGSGKKKIAIKVSTSPYAVISSNVVNKPGAEGIMTYKCPNVKIKKNTIKTTSSHIAIWVCQCEKYSIIENSISGTDKKYKIN
ncbi:MAG: right-handed parallel beta-helix repeat-containing protein [Lachnospiraceae bacterium]|nr:right-handed parallel beta-helix repeat-containing protein [Lachnospiraceae bacterium]